MISDCGHKYISAFKPSQQVTGEWWFFPDKLYNSSINPFLFPLLYFCFAFIDHLFYTTTQRLFLLQLLASDYWLVDANVTPC